MEVKGRFDHFNINVLDLDKSIAFYNKALGLKEHHRKVAEDGSFILVYLTDEQTGFLMELTWLRDRKEPYELGDNESHLCFRVAGDYEEVRKYHKEMGAVCFENTKMGLYFINDPDDYWIEIILHYYITLLLNISFRKKKIKLHESVKFSSHRIATCVKPLIFAT